MTFERESIDDIIERVTIDAYRDEGHEAFLCAFDDEVDYPINALLAGTEIDITKIDYDGNARRGLIADIGSHGDRHSVALLEVRVDSDSHFSALVLAYRRWLGEP